MNGWAGALLRILFAFVILFLVGFLTVSLAAIFHTHNNLMIGVTLLAAAFSLTFAFERVFPAVYARRRRMKWWQRRGTLAWVLAIIAGVLSSRIATLWFGLVMISGVLVAVFLHATRPSADRRGSEAK